MGRGHLAGWRREAPGDHRRAGSWRRPSPRPSTPSPMPARSRAHR